MKAGLSLAEIQRLPAVVDLVTAGQALGLGRTKTYALARTGDFPCRLIRVGKSYLVPTAELLSLLGLPPAGAPREPCDRPDTSAGPAAKE
ncbi:DNA-binding protein [Actinoallomurus iriomotensis]|uniref:Helix-turn-helix domain-containing protein n=1 Tax=Actinoallomurus iriomotensis TaxID=478107 RepID=A0A9W6S2L2_9ACTN|nr:DNA-binding protein [Actinoallomurus iriomotensis]GLY86073.1 hypothetical protein Airi02_040020 [Actinoallomurus iriomotensis]